MRKYLLVLFVIINCLNALSQDFKTLTYLANDSVKLDLDLFLPKDASQKKNPLFIFVHGGGFSDGDKKSGHPICQFLSEKGYAAASINYTLYMKNKEYGCKGVLSEKINAIKIATNQLWQATLFFIINREDYNIDIDKIFIGGNSAGGTTVLHSAFWNPDSMNIYPNKLPLKFKYAGVISGAGALMDLSLVKSETLIPVMFFHGTCDDLVPYGTAPHHYCPEGSTGWLKLYGSYTLYNKILALGGSCCLVTFCGGNHLFNDKLFITDQQKVSGFIERVVKGEEIHEHELIKTGNKCSKSLEYKFCD